MKNKIKQNVIIVAGGKGLRMGTDIPKQFIPVMGLPVLMHTIRNFHDYNPEINIVLVLPTSHQNYWEELKSEYNFTIPHHLANGGETRFHSVKNGLEFVDEGITAVQDGVRPFASKTLIARCFEEATKNQNAVPAIPSKDSLRIIYGRDDNQIIDRNKIVCIQTPQVFDTKLLKRAYKTPFEVFFTDDASVVEHAGHSINLVTGEEQNIKITTPIDLQIAELLIKNQE